jgi:predicted component of type VI protein secretion system
MNYNIRVISKSAPPQKFQLEQGENLVGRSRSAQIRIKEPDVSGKHFIIRVEGDAISVENLSSKGIYLDDQMLFENSPVRVGQHIFAGEALECIIEDEELSRRNDEQNFSHNFSQDALTPGSHQSNNETALGVDTGTGQEPTDQSQNRSQTSDSHGTNTGDSQQTGGSQHTDDSSLNTDDSANTTGKSRDTAANKTRVATPAEIARELPSIVNLSLLLVAPNSFFSFIKASLISGTSSSLKPIYENGFWVLSHIFS